jgi:predicted permease
MRPFASNSKTCVCVAQRRENVVFESLAGYTSPRVLTWQRDGLPERLFGEVVTGNYFATLGLEPAGGRFFSLEEDAVPGGHPIAVMNYATWQTRFGGSPGVLGQAIRVNNVVLTVIGVAPARFIGVNAIFGPDLWVPASMAEALFPNEMGRALSDRAKAIFLGVGRLQTGTTHARAQANMTAIATSLAREYPEANKNHSVSVRPIGDTLFGASGPGSTSLVFASFGLLLVVAVLLAIACSNLVNLMLVRAMARGSEIAVRIALGATRARLVRQWLTESALLGLLSGGVGAGIGYAGVKVLWAFRPAEVAANLVSPHLDWSVLVYTFVVAAATGIFVGIAPAVRASKIEISEKLKEESRSVGRQRRRVTLANALLVAQVAGSFRLLATAMLFVRSMQHAYDVDPGFQTKHLVVVLTNPGQAGYTRSRTSNFYNTVRERISTLPGVDSVSWASNLPLWGRLASGLRVEGHDAQSRAGTITTIVNTVDVNYFER